MNKHHDASKKYQYSFWFIVAGCVMITTLACSLATVLLGTIPAPTALPTYPSTETITPPPETATASPTSPATIAVENTSTPEPEATATQMNDLYLADIRSYYEKGYLFFQNGKMTSLPDFSKKQPAGDVINDFSQTGFTSQDFVLWADIELNSIGSTRYPNYTGCGFAYRVQSGSAGYTAILTNDYVRMGACSNNLRHCELFGTIAGDGKVNVPNKTMVRFSLIVNRERAYALVDNVLAGQYALYTTRLQGEGDLYYAAVSNYAAGYWTTCQMTNIRLWESYP